MSPGFRGPRFLLKLYPESFRQRFGRELLQHWHLERDAAVSGISGPVNRFFQVTRFWIALAASCAIDAARLRVQRDPGEPIPPPDPKESPMRLETLLLDLRHALRGLRRRPAWTVAAVLTLTLGLGATTAVFSIVHDVLLRPLPYPEPERLLVVAGESRENGRRHPVLSYPSYELFRDTQDGLETLAAWSVWRGTVETEASVAQRSAGMLSDDLLSVLRAVPEIGRGISPGDGEVEAEAVVVLGHALWQRDFGGDPAVLGRRVEIDEEPHVVVGVMPRGFSFPSADTELWISLRKGPRSRDHYYLHLLGRARSGYQVEAVQARLAARELEMPDGSEGHVVPVRLEGRPLLDDLVSDLRPQLVLFLAAVTAVLLVACLNVANLILTRGAGRRHELAMRASLGAGRSDLVRQQLAESLLVGLGGGILGVGLAASILEGLHRLGTDWMPRAELLGLDPMAIFFALGLASATGIVVGLLPALRASAGDPARDLRVARGAAGMRVGRLRAVLIVGQVAGAMVLVLATFLLVASFRALERAEQGFNNTGVAALSIDLPSGRYPDTARQRVYYEALLERLHALPEVSSAAVASSHPFTHYFRYRLGFEGFEVSEENAIASLRVVDEAYFKTVGAELRAGRLLAAEDREIGVVVNETFARRFFPDVGAVGRRVHLEGDPEDRWRTIVGTIADIRFYGQRGEVAPEIYFPYADLSFPWVMTVLLRTEGDPLALAPALREATAAVDPRVPIGRAVRLDDLLWRSKSAPRLRTILLSVFGLVALLLAAVGVYGLMACRVVERRREIGVRLALGAAPRTVSLGVLGHGLILALAGVGLGLVASLPVARLLEAYLVGLEAHEPWILIAVTATLLGVAGLASWLPARRAARVDPMEALRVD